MNEEDQDKIYNFLNTGIFTHQQMLENILTLILQNKAQEAFDKALESEKKGYKGILYQVGEFFLDKGYIQPAYVVFSNVPDSDKRYVEAQINAAKLATQTKSFL